MGKEAAAERPGEGRFTRRVTMRGLIAFGVASVTAPAALLWPTRHAAGDRTTDDRGSGAGAFDDRGSGAFDEMYEGRHIRGARVAGGRQDEGAAWEITVDGRPLHLMRRADGGYLSMVDHYQSYPTPLIATRRAVDELGPGQQLRDNA
ncbi:tyrosinase [Streptomyces longisporoflavus]|uniref:tyrosinase cofactor n=1 Tax=Streptomyces longisporoflavus TaxID=28044 RepID=UPI0019A7391C|nr:tyrosinase cofactor [Streptomyces longisporoflavus]GGV69480.1 tyrosinase [Streptomyces longisporoflavus]